MLTASDSELRAIRGNDISVVFQEPMTSLNPVFTVGWQIAEVLKLHTDLTGRALNDRIIQLLNEVGIPEPKARVDAYPHELSGGQQQRVMIAMAIACEPKLLIADEPTTALDVTVQRQILELIARSADKPSDERAVHQPRSRVGGRDRGSCRGDARRDRARIGPGRSDFRRAAGCVHEGVADVPATARRQAKALACHR